MYIIVEDIVANLITSLKRRWDTCFLAVAIIGHRGVTTGCYVRQLTSIIAIGSWFLIVETFLPIDVADGFCQKLVVIATPVIKIYPAANPVLRFYQPLQQQEQCDHHQPYSLEIGRAHV